MMPMFKARKVRLEEAVDKREPGAVGDRACSHIIPKEPIAHPVNIYFQ